jgi:hypothetical protein
VANAMPVKEASSDHCPACGAAVADGEAGCQRLFDVLLARDFSDPLFFSTHRMAVDTYSLQHPERYCASAKSLAAHLISLHCMLEEGGNQSVGDESIHRWLNGARPLQKPELPTFRGGITVAEVVVSETPAEYKAAVHRWAASTWAAYSSLHTLARTWLQEAEASRSSRRHR